MKTILLIGSTGFIGSELKRKLKKKFKIISVSRKKGFDISDFYVVKKLVNKNIDIIINLSGQISTKKKMLKTIIKGNRNIIRALENEKRKPLIYFFSTTLVYGFSDIKLSEKSKLRPVYEYSKIKRISELDYIKSNLNYKILRVSNVYNEKKAGIINFLINCFISKKKLNITNVNSLRNYIHIDDLTNLIEKMLQKNLKYNIYNIGFQNFSIKEIISAIENKFQIRMNYLNHKIKLKDISSHIIKKPRIFSEVNFSPKVKLEKFIIKAINK